jgi:hypothetical protein
MRASIRIIAHWDSPLKYVRFLERRGGEQKRLLTRLFLKTASQKGLRHPVQNQQS